MDTIRIKNKFSNHEKMKELEVKVRMCIFRGRDLRSGKTSSEMRPREASLGSSLVGWCSASGSPGSHEERLCRSKIQWASQRGLAPSPALLLSN